MKKMALFVFVFLFVSEVGFSASISFFIGKVNVKKNNIWIKAKRGIILNNNDAIKTGKNSMVILTLKRGSNIKLRENSSIVLENTGTKRVESVSLRLLKGSVFSKVLRRKTGELFNVKAGTLVVAVRGTEFFVAQEKLSKKTKDLWVCVNEGSIDIIRTTDGKSVIIPEGKGILIKNRTEFTHAKEYRWTGNLNWNMSPKKGSVVDKTNILKAYYDILDYDYD